MKYKIGDFVVIHDFDFLDSPYPVIGRLFDVQENINVDGDRKTNLYAAQLNNSDWEWIEEENLELFVPKHFFK